MPPDQLSRTFSALADPTRRAILARLASGEASVTELAEPFDMSLPAISKHLKVLERAGLITRGREAQWRPCRLHARPLKGAADWLEHYRIFWEQSLDRLEDYLKELQGQGEAPWPQTLARRSANSSSRASSMRRAAWCSRRGRSRNISRAGGDRRASPRSTARWTSASAAPTAVGMRSPRGHRALEARRLSRARRARAHRLHLRLGKRRRHARARTADHGDASTSRAARTRLTLRQTGIRDHRTPRRPRAGLDQHLERFAEYVTTHRGG